MRDELLALLEAGPETQSQLAAWLQRPLFMLGRELQAMASEGLVKQVGNHRRWALASHEPRTSGRPRKHPASVKPKSTVGSRQSRVPTPELTRIENVAIELPPQRYRRSPADLGATVDRQLGIVEPVSGIAVCAAAGCGKRFTPDRESERYCSERCQQIGPPGDRRTVMVDGVEYEAVSIGAKQLCQWPEDQPPSGSSLSGLHAVKNP